MLGTDQTSRTNLGELHIIPTPISVVRGPPAPITQGLWKSYCAYEKYIEGFIVYAQSTTLRGTAPPQGIPALSSDTGRKPLIRPIEGAIMYDRVR